MKYYKSKSGYFYKVVGDKKTRISMEEYKAGCKKRVMKGGFTKEGNVESRDFDIMAKLNNGNKKEFELQNMSNMTNKDLQISILFNKNGIPHIFLDYNLSTGRYNFVIYYVQNNKINKLVIKKINEDGNISEVELAKIGRFKMLLLCNEFLQKYQESNQTKQMINMYNLLKTYFTKFMENKPDAFKNITGSSNTPHHQLAEEILAKFESNQ
jgi:hypothetical protein